MKITSLFVVSLICLAVSSPAAAACKSTRFNTLQERTESPYGVHNLETVDYDSDGVLDLIGLIDTSNSSSNPTLYAWHGEGNGTFAVPVSLGTTGVLDVAVSDVNNDGNMDLVMAVSDPLAQIVVRLGNGSTFGAAISQSLSYTPTRLVAVKVDGDAYDDLVVTGLSGDRFVVYHGTGEGRFNETRTVTTGHYPRSVVAADFDGDGRVDVAYCRFDIPEVDVHFQNSDGTFASAVALQSAQPSTTTLRTFASDLATADFDEDGLADLVATNWEEEGATASVALFRSSAARTFTRTAFVPRASGIGSTFEMVRAADIDNDGHADITACSVNGGVLMAWAGKGDGSFNSPTYYRTPDGSGINSFALGDFNADGTTDTASGTYGKFYTATGSCATQAYLYTESPVVTFGKIVPLRAIVSGIGSDTALPRGTVTFREGATAIGTADVDASGYAALDKSGLEIGTHSLSADFAGASTATSQTITQKVIAESSITTLLLPSGPSVYGNPYNAIVTIIDQFGDNSGYWFTLDIDGVRTRRVSNVDIPLLLNPGSHTITALFEGNALVPASASDPQTITTIKATPSMAATGGLTVRLGQTSTFTLNVSGPAGVNGPTGSVDFIHGSTVVATANLVNGSVTFSRTLERGNYDLTAVYSGDANFNGASLDVTLTVLPNLTVAIDARSLPDTIAVRALLPNAATSVILYRRVSGTGPWVAVNGWTPQFPYDTAVPARGVLYEYKLTVMSGGTAMTSNIDPAMLFTDPALIPSVTPVSRVHWDELRIAVNGLRSVAGLPAFDFDPTYLETTVRASHLESLRNALKQAREVLGMSATGYTDEVLVGAPIKAVHIQEIRTQAF